MRWMALGVGWLWWVGCGFQSHGAPAGDSRDGGVAEVERAPTVEQVSSSPSDSLWPAGDPDALVGIGVREGTVLALYGDGQEVTVADLGSAVARQWLQLRASGDFTVALWSESGTQGGLLLDRAQVVSRYALREGGTDLSVARLSRDGSLVLRSDSIPYVPVDGSLRRLPQGAHVIGDPPDPGLWPVAHRVDKQRRCGFFDASDQQLTYLEVPSPQPRPVYLDGSFHYLRVDGPHADLVAESPDAARVIAGLPIHGETLSLQGAGDWLVLIQDRIPTHRIHLSDHSVHVLEPPSLNVGGRDWSEWVLGTRLIGRAPERWPAYRLDIATGEFDLHDGTPDLGPELRPMDASYCDPGLNFFRDGRLGFALRDDDFAHYFTERIPGGPFEKTGLPAQDVIALSAQQHGQALQLAQADQRGTYCPTFPPFEGDATEGGAVVGPGVQVVDAQHPPRFAPLFFPHVEPQLWLVYGPAMPAVDAQGDWLQITRKDGIQLHHLTSGAVHLLSYEAFVLVPGSH